MYETEKLNKPQVVAYWGGYFGHLAQTSLDGAGIRGSIAALAPESLCEGLSEEETARLSALGAKHATEDQVEEVRACKPGIPPDLPDEYVVLERFKSIAESETIAKEAVEQGGHAMVFVMLQLMALLGRDSTTHASRNKAYVPSSGVNLN